MLDTAGIAGSFNMTEAVGAFMVSATLITLCGVTGRFEKVMNRILVAIASALLAGVLARFAMSSFSAGQTALPLVLLTLVVYPMGRRFMPRYAVVATLLVGIAYAASKRELAWSAVSFTFTTPVFVMPVFSFSAVLIMAIPLFVVTMALQNLPGVAAIRATGYEG